MSETTEKAGFDVVSAIDVRDPAPAIADGVRQISNLVIGHGGNAGGVLAGIMHVAGELASRMEPLDIAQVATTFFKHALELQKTAATANQNESIAPVETPAAAPPQPGYGRLAASIEIPLKGQECFHCAIFDIAEVFVAAHVYTREQISDGLEKALVSNLAYGKQKGPPDHAGADARVQDFIGRLPGLIEAEIAKQNENRLAITPVAGRA